MTTRSMTTRSIVTTTTTTRASRVAVRGGAREAPTTVARAEKAAVTVEDGARAAFETNAAAAGSAVAKQIDELAATRKELVAGKFKDKHANMGYLLLALGVTLAVEGGMNTYLRVGKLFPGPHLYAGASIVVLWAMAAGLVPQMEKG